MAWIHDEQQIACRTEEIAKIVCEEAQQAMRDTQKYFNFHVQLDTEGIIGHNWFDCHQKGAHTMKFEDVKVGMLVSVTGEHSVRTQMIVDFCKKQGW